MKKFLLAAATLSVCFSASAQLANVSIPSAKDPQVPEHRTCGVMDHEQYLQSIDPNRATEVQAYEQQLQMWINAHQNQISTQAAITIPVVVHVVYNNAAQNISNAQVQSQITVLNQDFTATNTDIGLVPSAWTSLVANVDINFCLAQQDPTGAPTTGIHRVSTATASFSTNDNVKHTATGGTDAWDPTRYFNIWCCNLGGGVLGYAEFPTATVSQTYGLVVGYSYFGNTGTVTPPYNLGRTATHEIGHCYNLRHIWGDDGTACSGSDLVADTPNQAGQNFGCPTYPLTDACSGAAPGVMFMNYMDYTDDACMYMFTNGQKTRMLAVLNTAPYNALTTSTACTPPANSPPTALFVSSTQSVCPGNPVTFTDQSTSNTTTWAWTFPSGTPASSSLQNPPTVTWATPGTYTVTLVASNVNGNSTYTMAITVLGTVNPPLTEGFEGATYVPANWSMYDAGNNGQVWTRANVGRNSSWSSKFDNYNINVNGLRDEIRTPRMNFSAASTVSLTFDVAYRQYNTAAASQDTLEVLYSTNCGATWTQVYIKGSSTLSTVAGTQTTAFTPTNTQWRNESVNLNAVAGNSGVMIAFRNRGHYGNNLYVDNVNITTTTSSLPNGAFTASATSVCAGTAVSFTDNSTNTPTSWTWTFPSGTPASATTQNVASVVWNTAGTYTVTHTATNASGTGTTTQVITVLANPTVTTTTSGATICNGSSTTITASGASTYAWMPGSLTGSPVTVSPTATTSYTVTGTAANGCTGTAVRTITVNPTPTVTATSSTTTICSGSSVTLTGTGASTYAWNPGALTGATVTVSPTTTTTYTMTGTGANGCTAQQTVAITVNPTPTVTTTASSTTICAGSSTTITASGATSYTWMPGSLTGTSVTVSPTTTTTYTVTGTNGGCNGTATRTITVNAAPTLTMTPVSGSVTICQGSSTTISGSTTANHTYSWSPTVGLATPNAASTVASPTVTTTYVLTKTRTSTGCSTTGTVVVIVNPTPSVTATPSSSSICTGNSVTLTGSGASTYSWMPGSLTGTTVTTTPAATTTYTVTGTSAAGCTGTATVTVTVGSQPTVTATSSSPSICTGGSATLTGNGGTTYTWMPGSLTGSSVTVSPASTTTYTVTGSNGPGCSNTATVTVTLNSLPTVSASSSASAVCAGTTVTLTGGGAVSYNWMPGSLSGTSVTDTPSSSTTYTVTGTDANGCSNTSTVNVAVNSLPTVSASASSSSICEGTSVTLTGSGASTYDWMPGSLTGTSVTDTPVMSTTYTVTGTDANGCSNTSTISIAVNTLPTVSAASSAPVVCSGSTVMLSATGATTYNWAPVSLSGATITDAPAATTTYTVTGTDGNGCSNTAMTTVTVNATPVVTITLATDTFCDIDGPTALAGGSPAGGTYSGPGVSGNAFDASSVGAGTYTIMYTYSDVNGCSDSASQSVVVDVCNGISSNDNGTTITVLPNPNNGNFTLMFNSPTNADYVIEIHNALGQVVYTEQVTSFAGAYRKDISLENFGKGMYTVRLRASDTESTIRIITE